MTLPLHLLAPEALAGRGVGDVVVLDGPEGRHAATVRRTRVGEHLLLTDGAGLRLEGEVVAVGSGTLDLRVVSVAADPEPSPRLVLVQALAKNDRDDQAVEAATECGVDEVVPWQAARSVVQWRGERGEKARRKWDAVLVAATKQSRRTRRPVLAPTASTAEVAALVQRSTDPSDARAWLIDLTPLGRRRLGEIRNRLGTNIEPMLETLSARDRKALRAGLEVMRRMVSAR